MNRADNNQNCHSFYPASTPGRIPPAAESPMNRATISNASTSSKSITCDYLNNIRIRDWKIKNSRLTTTDGFHVS
jgi:hypothetical protein